MKKHVIKFKGHRKLFKHHSRKLKKMAMMTRMSRGTGFLGHHHHHGHHGHDFPWIGFSGVGFHERRLSRHDFPGSDGFKKEWHGHGDDYSRGKHDHHKHGPHKPYHPMFHGFCKFGQRGPNHDTENDQGMDAAEKSSKLPTPICSAENSQGVDVTERADVPERSAESRAPDVRKSEFPGRRGKGKHDHHGQGRNGQGFRKYMRHGFHHDTESDPGKDAAESSSSSSRESSSSDFSKLWFHGPRGHCGKKQHGHHKHHHYKFHGFCKFGQYGRRHDAEIDQGTDGAERSSKSPASNFCAENSQDVDVPEGDVPEKSTESRAPDVCKSAFPGRRGHCGKRKPDHHGHGPHKHDHRKFHGFSRCGRRGFHHDAGSDPGMDAAESSSSSSSSSSSDSSSSDFYKLWFHGRRGHCGKKQHGHHKHHHHKFHGFCKFGQYGRRHDAEIDHGTDGAERSSESPNPNRCPENNQGMNAPKMQEDTAAPNGDAESNQAMDVSETLNESPASNSGEVEPLTSKD